MKKLLVLSLMFVCSIVFADTINLHWLNEDGTTYQNSTCTVDNDLIVPTTPPTKYGYTFTGWKIQNYTLLEYIKSTGTQYVDTGVVLTNDIEILARIGPTTVNVCSFMSSGECLVIWQSGGDVDFRYPSVTNGVVSQSSKKNYNLNKIYNIGFNIDKHLFTVENTQIEKLYNINNYGSIVTGKKDIIASIKIYNDGVLVRDFVPASDPIGTICLYDKVQNKFYYNQGTGDFIAGPVLTE